jgi:hypothetical protein
MDWSTVVLIAIVALFVLELTSIGVAALFWSRVIGFFRER